MKFKITKAPKLQMGGHARQQWNDSHNGVQPTKQWDHDPARANAGVTGIQQEFQNWQSDPFMKGFTKAPNGISPVDNWEGYQTGAYKYIPAEMITKRGDKVISDKNYGLNYEQFIADNNQYIQNRNNPQWQSNDQNIDIGPTPQQIQKYNIQENWHTAMNQQPQQGNWHTNEGTDYSVDSTRTAKFGGNMPNSYNQLDTRWTGAYKGADGTNTVNGSVPDPYQYKRTLPEAEPGMGDINAEKKEIVLGDFGGGIPSTMNVDGPPHTQGGKDVNVPEGSFVFSDTKALKIKDPQILRQFGEVKPKTPAQIAAKYNLQRFTQALSDPKSDNTTRKTAEMMTGNYLTKLSQLADHQELMKQQKGLTPPDQQSPQIQQPGMQNGGMPKAQMGMRTAMLLGSQHPGQYNQPKKGIDYGSDYMPYDEDIAAAQGYTGQYGNTSQGYQQFQHMTDPQNPNLSPIDNKFGVKTTAWKNPNMGWQRPANETIPQLPVSGSTPLPTNIQVYSPQQQTIGNTPVASVGPETQPLNTHDNRFTRPDQLAMLNSAVNYANIHKYLPYEPPVTGVIPETVFMDPRRAQAAISETANAQGNFAAQSGNGRTAAANYLALQGQSGKEQANVVGQYANQNSAIANSANQGAAGITNQLLEQQRNRLKALHQGNTIAAQQYDNAEREARGDMLNTYTNAWKNRQGYNDLNQTSQFFKRDLNTGFMYFNDEAGKAAFQKIMNGQGGGSNTSFRDWKQAYIDSGGPADKAEEFADDAYREQRGLRNRTKTETKQGNNKITSTSYAPSQKFGGPVNSLSKFINK